jgi:hypothetical protein
VWEGLLNQGDLLYIPRGWWHVATPLDEPTLHLTVGVSRPTGADLLLWFVERLKASEQVRRDLPQFVREEEQATHLEQLRQVILSAWRPNLIQEYLADTNAKSQPRPSLSFPWSPTARVLPRENASFTVKWAGSRPATLERQVDTQTLIIAAHGRRWKFASKAAPLLELLLSGRSLSWDEIEELGVGLDGNTIRIFLQELAESGLITISSEDTPAA